MTRYSFWVAIFLIAAVAQAHSIMTEPQSISPRDCRVGGEAKSGIDECHGPCDFRAIRGGYANFNSPSNPSATYHRGQHFTVKYTRNNHGPGGFVRLTIVPIGSMMDKAVHERNAFHYSCWGANPRAALPHELQTDHFGYTLVGNDGEEHPFHRGYYVVNATIPKVIPDGDYVFGWVWFGGIGSVPVLGNLPQPPQPNPVGYYSDQWSCAYIRIQGGYPLEQSYSPVFVNDISQYNTQGCLAANDSPGVCVREPCYQPGWFQKPRAFKDNSYPPNLSPALFATVTPSPSPPAGTGSQPAMTNYDWSSYSACRCIELGEQCDAGIAETARAECRPYVNAYSQPLTCVQKCCQICIFFSSWKTCSTPRMQQVSCSG